jgi:6-pyruvoyltetrahydropterin/6-carboxytetrahydropterin synthase
VAAETLDGSGMVVDFHELDEMMQDAMERFDHRHLNDVPDFEVANPSAENIARAIGDSVRQSLSKVPHVSLRYCDVFENDLSRARYVPDE